MQGSIQCAKIESKKCQFYRKYLAIFGPDETEFVENLYKPAESPFHMSNLDIIT